MRPFVDLQGQSTPLGRCIGKGGEGAVYLVPTRPHLVAKIYASIPDDHAARKLAAMVQLGTLELAKNAAWPQNLLMDENTGDVVGFLMPRIDGHREIHRLYGPIDRKTAFPDATWGFLVSAARNIAVAFETVHLHNHIIGDVNQGNVVVSRQATVQIIDCDSFQIRHLGRTYPCRVGVPLFTPPELQGRRLSDIVRTPDHDRFGLAVLIFQLLFMGRHPYAGRHPERAIDVNTAIKEGLFAFGAKAAAEGWEPPPHSLRIEELSPRVAHRLERAFGPAAVDGGPRPSAAEWRESLEQLDAATITCSEDPRHVHVRGTGPCPWCRIENDGGPCFFFLPPGAAPDAFDLATTWQAIEGVKPPGPARLRRVAPDVTPPRRASATSGGWLAAVAARLVALVRPDAPHSTREQQAEAIAAGEEELRQLESLWEDGCGETAFVDKRQELEEAKAALEGLKTREDAEWAALAERFRERPFHEHLRTFSLEFARIPGLGKTRLQALAEQGVTTALDIAPEALMSIRGIDLEVVKGLLVFKDVAARSFNFDPVTAIPVDEQKTLAARQATRRETLSATVQGGAVELIELRRETVARREELTRAADEIHKQLAELRASEPVSRRWPERRPPPVRP